MEKIKIIKPTEDQKKKLNIPDQPKNQNGWSVWECGPSQFDWHYDSEETAYVYEGKVKVKTTEEEVEIKKGDLVVFPAGLSCHWHVIEKIRKVYRFG